MLKHFFKSLPSLASDNIKSVFKVMMLKSLAAIFALFLAVFAITSAFNYLSERYQCHVQWVDSDVESKYTYRGGCLVQIDEKWIPAKNYRVN